MNHYLLNFIFPKIKKIVIGNVYRPPNNHPILNSTEQFHQFFDTFSNSLNNLASLNTQVIIGGDFNLDALKYGTNRNVTDYVDLLFSYGFLQLVIKPTRCTDFAATLIDHFLTNNSIDSHNTVIITSKISDHFPVVYISKTHKNHNKPTLISYRDFSQYNYDRFLDALNSINWNVMTDMNDTQQIYDFFSETFLSIFNLYFPILFKKANKNNQPMNPWMTRGLLISRKQKIHLSTLCLKKPSLDNKNRYISYRNIYAKLIKLSKKLYFQNKLEKISQT